MSDIDGWFASIVRDLVALLAAAWRAIRELTGFYVEDHAAAEGRTVEPSLAEWNTEQVLTNLRVTGPVAFKTAIRDGRSEDEALESMTTQMAGAAEKIVLRGDRDTVMATVDDSDEIVGWRRVSDGDPCSWCAMLISRGAVYKSGRTAGDVRFGGNEYHDHDRCTAEPLYEREPEPPEVADLYQQWRTATAGKSGNDAMRAWRDYWDNRDRPAQRQPEPEPALEPAPPAELDDRQQRARERQQQIDTARARAELLAELEEIAVINEARGDELARMARVAADRFGVADDAELAALLRRAAEGDAAMVEATLEAVARRLGLTRIGGDLESEQIIRFDRSKHDMLPGERSTPFVEVVRPGYIAVIDGGELVIVRAVVAPTSNKPAERKPEPEEIKERLSWLDDVEDWGAIVEAAEQGKPDDVRDRLIRKDEQAGRATVDIGRLATDPLKPVTKKRRAEVEQAARELFNGTHAGIEVRVTSVEVGLFDNMTVVQGDLLDARGRKVGHFTRGYRYVNRFPGPGRDLVARHETLEITDRDLRGQGFAGAFNAHLEASYRASGVKRITLTASLDNGGYAWARAGYDWQAEWTAANIATSLKRLVELFEHSPGDYRGRDVREAIAAAKALLKRMDEEPFGSVGFPTPYELSQLGRWPGAGRDDLWLGKQALLGRTWEGVKPL